MRDEVVKEVAVQHERSRTGRLQAIDPLDDPLLASFRQSDVRVADDDDLSRGRSHERGVYPSRVRLFPHMRMLLCSLLCGTSVLAQTMPQLAPVPAGSKPIAANPNATSFTFVVAGDNRPAKASCGQPPQLADVVNGIAALKPAFALWDGDIIYGKDPLTVAAQYPVFFAALAKANTPVFVSPGNHELSLKGTVDCPVPGKKKKEKPIDEPDPSGLLAKAWATAAGAPYGMFRYGNSAFIGINTDDSLNGEYNPGNCGYNGYVGNAQVAALTSALNTLQADPTVAHIFVFMHRPLNGSKSKDDLGPTSVPQIAK